MDINPHIINKTLSLKVIPNSGRNELIEENNSLRLYIKAIPDKNKANLEVIKFFKKEFNLRVEIVSGLKSREKRLKVL
ncbi:hypothetical protein COV20_00715 [Candidatus Woesearchaeota archaeon CG10_big_fil_rev_8_21_14_0_10_45_16]|nr:MAG: hypothetical protein COV20_00715 [Candidatus Woesearchaeota archaeon CG10_big_fil_rev_8_21_14_0_10_45_16]